MEKKKIIILTIVITILIIIGIILIVLLKKDIKNGKNSLTSNDIEIEINTDDGDQKIEWSNYEKREIILNKSITITEGGIYNLEGKIEDGLITIDTKDNVKLSLNNVKISNSNGPAIYIKNAEDVVIVLEDDTINELSDGNTYINYDEDVNGVIYSKDDITFEGNGTLKIEASYADGIVGKDDLKIINGTYIINSNDDGIRGKDSVYILNGNFEIKSLGDGIKSTNDTDTEKGFIKIENGTFNIEAGLDGIQAETKLLIENGNFTIKTADGSNIKSTSNNWGNWGNINQNNIDKESAKGIKAGDNLVIENGTFNLNTADDAIHTNNYIGIKSGQINITSGDDGIHADTELIIDGGEINITQSYEGLEASKITINNGNIKVVSTDDGINVAGGNDGSAIGGRPGQNNYNSNSNNILTINDGNIYVNSSGDGLDANGSIYIYGGNIIIDGPTSSGNGALDYDKEFVITNGLLIAAGASGMAQGISSNSTQYGVLIGFDKTITKEQTITIVDSTGKEIINYTGSKSYSSLVVSSNKFQKNNTYTIKIDGETYNTFKTNEISLTVGKISNNQGGMPNNHGRN